ncbi:MAG TPA: glycosyltransferase 87 family protein, partial [Chroococcales cyanobacterium]
MAFSKATIKRLGFKTYFVFLACWALITNGMLSLMHIQKWPLAADFMKLSMAGRLARCAYSTQIYDLQAQRNMLAEMIPAFATDTPFNQSSPMTFVLMAPWTVLPLNISFLLWNILGPLAAGVSLWFLVRKRGQFQASAFVALMTGVVACEPAFHNYWFGHFALFLLALLAWITKGLVEQRDTISGT